MNKKRLIILICFSVLAIYGNPVKKPQMTLESEAAVETWERVFHNKPIESLEDSRVLVKMFLLSPYGKKTVPARDMGLADIVVSRFGATAVRGTVSEEALLKRASLLKGGALMASEKEAVGRLAFQQQLHFKLAHPNADKFSFLLKDDVVNLHLTVTDETTMEKALASIARQHGLVCNYRKEENLSFKTLWLLLDAGYPILLEEKETGRWLMAFGLWRKDCVDYICLNDPVNTTVVGIEKWSQNPHERETLYLGIIMRHIAKCHNLARETAIKGKMVKDIRVDVKLNLPKFGFELTRYESSRYRAHVMTDWRESVEAWDDELRKTLKLKEVQADATIPDADAPSSELWDFYFQGHPAFTGRVLSGMTPLVLWRSKADTGLCSAMVSLIAAHDTSPWAWTLTANKMWLAVRDVPANDLLLPTQAELDALVALDEECGRGFRKRYETFTGVKYRAEYDFKVYDTVLVVDGHDSARMGEWILSQMGDCSTPEEALCNYAANTGKIALLEGGRSCLWELYKRAVHRNIPILLRTANAHDWRIVFGFLEHGGKRMLVTVAPSPDWEEGETNRQFGRDMPLPKGVQFEEFNEKVFIPFFIHNFKPNIALVKERINEIFKDNPAAVPLP